MLEISHFGPHPWMKHHVAGAVAERRAMLRRQVPLKVAPRLERAGAHAAQPDTRVGTEEEHVEALYRFRCRYWPAPHGDIASICDASAHAYMLLISCL